MDEPKVELKEWCADRFSGMQSNLELRDKNIHTRIDGMDKALKTSEINLERRLGELNQLREDVVKDRDQFTKVGENRLAHTAIDISIANLKLDVTNLFLAITKIETKYESRITMATVISILSAIFALAGVLTPWIMHKTP